MSKTYRVFVLLAILCAACPLAALADYERSAEGATRFAADVEARMLELIVELARAQWVQSTYIIEDTEILAALAYERVLGEAMRYATESTQFDGVELPPDVARKLKLLKVSQVLPAPSDGAKRQELTQIAASLESAYGRGRYCPEEGECLDLAALSKILRESDDPDEMLEAWVGWRTIAPPMRAGYQRFAELGNEGAAELGFADLGSLWRSAYDMEPDALRAEVDRLWGQVAPLYEKLHCYVRSRLNQRWGDELVPPEGPIPAHLLGNMWAQTWSNVYPLVAPAEAGPGFDLTELLVEKGLDEVEMVRYGERFFTSLGFDPLPESFWQRSQFSKPRDRDVVCHASAWDVDQVDDLRIKMCIEINAEDFSTVHHELGHNFYQRAYSTQPLLFRESAHDGFHEGIGDTIALSVTPGYLVELGLLDEEPSREQDLGVLLRMALDKIAFLPFGLLVDQWRWGVFSGEIAPADYNQAWWELREKYQGVAAPVARSEDDFDPGAKYHVPANTPYTRYFLAHILQFQFHRALCDAAGYEGPLHRCSIYGNRQAGDRLIRMLEMGASQPWPDAFETLVGERRMDASAIQDYFAPLSEWLDGRIEETTCGW